MLSNRQRRVDLVVHTHLHVDHVGWDGAFPNARYIMSEDSLAQRPHLRHRVEPLRDAGLVVLLEAELDVASGVRLVPTPGHTPGHASVFIESEGEELVVLGDVVVHELQLADPDLVYVSDGDPELSAATRKQVLAQLSDQGDRRDRRSLPRGGTVPPDGRGVHLVERRRGG